MSQSAIPFAPACLLLATFLFGCVGPHDVIAQRGDMLVQAGFRARPADTADRYDMLGSLPPNRFVHTSSNARPVYLYADLQNCHCLYIGSQDAYDVFKKQMVSLHLARDDQMKADMLIADWTASANRWEDAGH